MVKVIWEPPAPMPKHHCTSTLMIWLENNDNPSLYYRDGLILECDCGKRWQRVQRRVAEKWEWLDVSESQPLPPSRPAPLPSPVEGRY